jgi:hypothetical protein
MKAWFNTKGYGLTAEIGIRGVLTDSELAEN